MNGDLFSAPTVAFGLVLFALFKAGVAHGFFPPHVANAPLPAVVAVCLVSASLLRYRG